ncbi:MAG: hypothetical protein B6D64_08715 [Bacteroidetes bacterium 4484_276]|nr:MAG: hypothetical protein B6D64_08715 [Bacteroidetes bacterium 4484_276]OYT11315.1 MAG: hypothetical protein B6I19_11630 [Bacteroidetes bacterium 4572_114]
MIEFRRSPNCLNCNDCNKKPPLFSLLNKDELELINEDRFEVSYKAGEMMFKQWPASTHILMITSGMAKIYLEGPGGINLLLKIVKPI